MLFKSFPFSTSAAARVAIVPMAIGTLAGLAGIASAGVIYQDNFARGTSSSQLALDGSTPAPTDVPGATWNAQSNLTTDGTELNFTSAGSYGMALLPITPVYGDGATYAIKATLTSTTSGYWVGLGFTAPVTTPKWTDPGSANTLCFQALYDNGYEVAYTGHNSTAVGNVTNAAGASIVGVTLNDNTGTLDFYAFYAPTNNWYSFANATLTSAQVNSITDVYLTQSSGTGTVSNFSVTGPVPEPTTLWLMAAGGTALLLLGRRRNA